MSPAPADGPETKPAILVVDDDPSILQLVVLILQRQGYAPVATGKALEALQLVQASPFDVIVTDIVMPRLHGLELLKVARRRNLHTQVVVFTGAASPELGREAAALGASALLLKPITPEQLLDAVREAVRRSAEAADPPGESPPICKHCDRPIKDGAPRFRRGASDYFHPGCYELMSGARGRKGPTTA
jgi:DNA-binding NtrC family response regulator